jgi:hypothetical protein
MSVQDSKVQALGLLADVRACFWFNQTYFKSRLPSEYESGKLWVSPGIVSRPNARLGAILHVMRGGRDCALRSGVNPRLIYECNPVSNTTVPRATERQFNSGGLTAEGCVEPVMTHSYKVLSFH